MTRKQGYRVIHEPAGVQLVRLAGHGGTIGDAVAATVSVDGDPVLEVLSPPGRAAWGAEAEAAFRAAVRGLAATHHLLGRSGAVVLRFHAGPAPGGAGGGPAEEPVARAGGRP